MPVSVTHEVADRLTVRGPAGVACYRYGTLPKACLHPLATPSGRVLTGFEMSDHVWHRGLWFTVKFVNGTNYWEENAPFGVQVHTAGPTATPVEGGVRIDASLEWTSEATGVALRETRSILHRPVDADTAAVEWTSRLTAAQDLTLDRTPFTTWGGYGGLILRTSREFHNAHLLLPGGGPTKLITGTPAPWCLMNGQLDGGRDVKASFGFVDHPNNPRSPSPWYARCGPDVNYINAAFLFAEPMRLEAGRSLTFDYLVLLRDGHFTADEFAAHAEAYRNAPTGPT